MLTRELQEYYAELGDALREARYSVKMTQTEMGKAIGCTQVQISVLEIGTVRCPFDRIAAYLEVINLQKPWETTRVLRLMLRAVPLQNRKQLELDGVK